MNIWFVQLPNNENVVIKANGLPIRLLNTATWAYNVTRQTVVKSRFNDENVGKRISPHAVHGFRQLWSKARWMENDEVDDRFVKRYQKRRTEDDNTEND